MRNLSTLVGGVGGAVLGIFPAAFSLMLRGLGAGRYGVGWVCVMKYHSLYGRK